MKRGSGEDGEGSSNKERVKLRERTEMKKNKRSETKENWKRDTVINKNQADSQARENENIAEGKRNPKPTNKQESKQEREREGKSHREKNTWNLEWAQQHRWKENEMNYARCTGG